MKNNVFKVVLLQALPASGKSEVRNFMAHVEPGRLQEEFHIGENLQLDDFPYVHMMRRIDNELQAMGQERVFYPGEEPFKDGRDWGTLCNLLNEDYHDLMNRNVIKTDSAAKLLFDRLDRAGLAAGIKPRMGLLKDEIRDKLASILEKEARIMLNVRLVSGWNTPWRTPFATSVPVAVRPVNLISAADQPTSVTIISTMAVYTIHLCGLLAYTSATVSFLSSICSISSMLSFFFLSILPLLSAQLPAQVFAEEVYGHNYHEQ